MLVTFRNGDLFALDVAGENQPTAIDYLVELDVSPRVRLQLVRLARMIRTEIAPMKETRDKFIHLYGEDNGRDGFSITGPNDKGIPLSPNWPKYRAEMEELLGLTTKLEFDKVVLPANVDLKDKGHLLLAFEPFLEIAEDAPSQENGSSKEPIPFPQKVT